MLLRYLFPLKGKIQYNPFKNRTIENPKTIGEKIFNRRLELGLIQADIARRMDVCIETIANWETGRGEPQIRSFPKIIEFLGYFPMEIDTSTWAGRIKKYRFQKGFSQAVFALKLEVNESTIFHYERGEYIPTLKIMRKIRAFIE